MTEPKLTVGRVETWRPIDAENVLFRAGLQDDHIRSQRAAGYVRAAMRELVRELNGRLAVTPAPQPEAKAEPDYTCPKCGAWHDGKYFNPASKRVCFWGDIIAAANARIAELVRERDEAYRKGVAAAKEACAKRGAGAMSEVADAPDKIEVEGLPRSGEPGHVDWYVVATWRTATKKQADRFASMLREQMGVPDA